MKIQFIGLLLYATLSGAVSAASINGEIEHLLDFVASSGCTFERNGSQYDSVEARNHIQRKYNHIKKRVRNTEDFIRYTASQSSISGKQYHATCNGKTITSKEWLTTELKRYRQQEKQ